jgi:uncharacterized protein YyaL (SSP411 family)
LTGDALAERVAHETYRYLVDHLRTPEGGFASAYDADTNGVEGLTYVWTPTQLDEVLGEEDAAFAKDLFGVTEDGNFEHGATVLTLARDADAAGEQVRQRWADVRRKLSAARKTRPQPAMDDKVVAAWNGLAITAMCEYARYADTKDWSPIIEAATLLAETHMRDGRLRRVSRNGVVGEPVGVLEDYGCVAEAYAALHQLTGDARWLRQAQSLLDTAVDLFVEGDRVFDTARDAQKLVTRPADPTDNATPSGSSALANALIAYSALSGEPSYRERAEAVIGRVSEVIAQHPRFAGYAGAAAEALLSGPVEIAIATDDPADPLVRTAVRQAPAGAVIVVGRPDQAGVPLLASRPLVDGRATAYVCRGFVCERPVTDSVALSTMLTA